MNANDQSKISATTGWESFFVAYPMTLAIWAFAGLGFGVAVTNHSIPTGADVLIFAAVIAGMIIGTRGEERDKGFMLHCAQLVALVVGTAMVVI